jgi:hypothetical protein
MSEEDSKCESFFIELVQATLARVNDLETTLKASIKHAFS